MKKKGNNKWKLWLIRIIIFLIIPLFLISILYLTNNLDIFISKTKEEVTKLSFFSLVLLIIIFIGDIFKGWVSNFISDKLFPGDIKYIKETVDKVDEKIDKLSNTTDEILQKINIDPRIIKKYLDNLSTYPSLEKKEAQIKKWYDAFEINPTINEILLLIVKHKQETILALEERIKNERDSVYKEALENLNSYLENGDAEKIKNNYFQFIKQQKKKNIEFLNESINASKQLFAFDETIDLYTELIKLEPTAKNYFDFGLHLHNLNYFDDAITQYKEVLQILRVLAKENPITHLPNIASTLNNLANLYSKNNELEQALEKYKEALQIRRKLAIENPNTYLPDVAITLDNLANLYSENNELEQALEKYKEALQIKRKLAIENPNIYLPDVAITLNNSANLYSKKNELEQALEKYKEALQIRRKLAIENPNIYLPDVAITLNNLANLYSNNNELQKALEKYKEVLKIYRELVKENPRIYLPHIALTLNNFSVLHSKRNELELGLKKCKEALQIRRKLGKENPNTYLSDIAMTLSIFSILLSKKNEFQLGLEKHEEALKIYKELAKENPSKYDLKYVVTLIVGIELFNKSKKNLVNAKIILKKYKNLPYANDLLKIINKLGKE